MDARYCTAITGACKNARFSVWGSAGNSLYSALINLGHQLEKIHTIGADDGCILDYSPLVTAWNECVNKRDFFVSGCSIEYAKAIMATPKKHLKRLSIALYRVDDMEESEVKIMMNIFSQNTCSVENFEYSGWPISGDAFDAFITRNKSSLTAVSILSHDVISEEKMDTLLPLLHKCPGLERVSGQRFSQSMLKALQIHGVQCVQFCDYNVLPLYSWEVRLGPPAFPDDDADLTRSAVNNEWGYEPLIIHY